MLAQYLDLSKVPTSKLLPPCWNESKETRKQHSPHLQPMALVYGFPDRAMRVTVLRSQGVEETRPSSVLLSRRRKREALIPSSTPGCPQDNVTAWRRGALTQALAGALGRSPPPRPVIEERKTLFTVDSIGVMFAVTHQLVKFVLHTLACVPIAFAPGERRDARKYETATKSRERIQTHDVHRELKTTTERSWVYHSKL